MATTEILLVKPVEGLGHEGEQVKVRAGYARNYLLPQKLAVPVAHTNKKQVAALQRRREDRLAKELEGAKGIAARLATVRIALAVKTGPGGKLFGSVSATDLANRLAEEQIPVAKKAILLGEHIKTLGKHVAQIKLHAEVQVDLEFEVVSENPIIPEEGSTPAPAAAAPTEQIVTGPTRDDKAHRPDRSDRKERHTS